MRDQAKVVNFGIIYGMSAHGLGQRLKIPVGEAQTIHRRVLRAYAGVKAWIDGTLDVARASKATLTPSAGVGGIWPTSTQQTSMRGRAAERVAVNAPIQGSSADMIKMAMIGVDAAGCGTAICAPRMIMQVHDELIFDVPEGELEPVTARVCELMRDALPLEVPVTVVTGHGPNWAEC